MERFWSKVNKTATCWNWTAKHNGNGYGQFKFQGKYVYAYRYSYELVKGPIPKGLTIDHLCRNHYCVNPDHLEAVTSDENNRRSPFTVTSINRAKTHCNNGHEFTKENTYIYLASGKRACNICRDKWELTRQSRRSDV